MLHLPADQDISRPLPPCIRQHSSRVYEQIIYFLSHLDEGDARVRYNARFGFHVRIGRVDMPEIYTLNADGTLRVRRFSGDMLEPDYDRTLDWFGLERA